MTGVCSLTYYQPRNRIRTSSATSHIPNTAATASAKVIPISTTPFQIVLNRGLSLPLKQGVLGLPMPPSSIIMIL